MEYVKSKRLKAAGYLISWLIKARPRVPYRGDNIERVVEQFADSLNLRVPTNGERWTRLVILNGLHNSGSDPKKHVTVAAATETMRTKCRSIIHHIYLDETQATEEMPEGVYDGHQLYDREASDRDIIRKSYQNQILQKSIFDELADGYTTVGYSPDFGYYMATDTTGLFPVTLTPYDPEVEDNYWFEHPTSKTASYAYFPRGCGIPHPTRVTQPKTYYPSGPSNNLSASTVPAVYVPKSSSTLPSSYSVYLPTGYPATTSYPATSSGYASTIYGKTHLSQSPYTLTNDHTDTDTLADEFSRVDIEWSAWSEWEVAQDGKQMVRYRRDEKTHEYDYGYKPMEHSGYTSQSEGKGKGKGKSGR